MHNILSVYAVIIGYFLVDLLYILVRRVEIA